MRSYGNGIQNLYGQLSILAPSGQAASILSGSAGQAAQLIANGGGGAQFILGAAGVAASTEYAGNGNTIGTTSLFVGQQAGGGSAIVARAGSLAISAVTNVTISAPSGLVVTDSAGSVWTGAAGGVKGAGTINAAGLFVNGVAVGAGNTQVAVKAADTVRVNTSAAAADPDLTLTLATGTYIIELGAIINCGSVPGFNLQFNRTLTANSPVTELTSAFLPTTADTNFNSAPFLTNTAMGNAMVVARASLVVSASGSITLAWGQATSNAASTTFSAGSYLQATKIA